MSDVIRHFLVRYDIGRQSADVEAFGEDYDAALIAYAAAEKELRADPQVEVVLLGADSEQTIRRTHSSYFMGAESDDPFAAHLARAGVRAPAFG
ncbi:hypothetical protein AB0L40_09385 [Patulibacter sp. NPDC049589]|uniref:hypothetical protein n=1 Tax=Patulibacter sp. NPDC049589 TaxID=3154731 RepID=UPI0034219756